MSTRGHVATRKGLFTIERLTAGWSVVRVGFLGDNRTLVMNDPRNSMPTAWCTVTRSM